MARNLAEEIVLSQRLATLIPPLSIFRCVGYDANRLFFSIQVPTDMRISPTLVDGIETTDWQIQNMDQTVETGFSISSGATLNNFLITATKNSHGLTDGSLRFNTGINYFDARF